MNDQPAPAPDEPVTLAPPAGESPPDAAPAANTRGKQLGMRLLYVVLIWAMLGIAATLLSAVTVIQFIIMLTNQSKPNDRLAEFGVQVGEWVAKAARFQSAATEDKPWPWSDMA